MKSYVIGLDYGSDSVRAVLVNALTGEEKASSIFYYPRWKEGKYCEPSKNMFRQHPKDYIEGLEYTIKEVISKAPLTADKIAAISVDTTGSTPAPITKECIPLALTEGFEENPNAMFILWKDHTATKEAAEINALAKKYEIDYTKYIGGIYSSEWFWAKILHTIREDESVYKNAYSWIEHCDWITAFLVGSNDVSKLKRSRCAAGHKAMWHEEFNGLPSEDFLTLLDKKLKGIRDRLYEETYTSNEKAGVICEEWAKRLGISGDVVIGVGAFDAHMGAVGGEIEPYALSKVIGTSTCDMLTAPKEDIGKNLVEGICGQVDGSIEPGMIGLEAGQSAFGDLYAWFRKTILWSVDKAVKKGIIAPEAAEKIEADMLKELGEEAEKIELTTPIPLAVDWQNGRRTPDADQSLKGSIFDLTLASDTPKIYKALVEATAFGARAIVERFEKNSIPIKSVIALGGVAKKSSFVMQTLADVLNRPIKVAASEQTCALGAAMFASVVGGIHSSLKEAQKAMGKGFEKEYNPKQENIEHYNRKYIRYLKAGKFTEKMKEE